MGETKVEDGIQALKHGDGYRAVREPHSRIQLACGGCWGNTVGLW
jgi:hypothetical protein